ncbi:MAG: PAS domain-containing protein [Leptolyngbyaceae cyanobacterium SM1_1_3]|nr:PAS domain-containing protein [Leptolyngbyaceae cyanobacterium SM1_1_3]
MNLTVDSISQAIDSNFVSVSPECPAQDAIDQLYQASSRCLLVVKTTAGTARLVGWLTEQDIVRAAASQIELSASSVQQLMSQPPAILQESSLPKRATALQMLAQSSVSALPVVDRQEQIIGLLSSRRLLQLSTAQPPLPLSIPLQQLLAELGDMVWVLDAQGRYLQVVPTEFERTYQLVSASAGQTLADVFSVSQVDYFISYIRQALSSQTGIDCEYWLMIEKRKRWYSTKILPLSDWLTVWISQDITVYKAIETTLLKQSAQLTQFASNLGQLHRLQLAHFESLEDLFADYIKTGCDLLNFSAGAVGAIAEQTYTILAVRSDIAGMSPHFSLRLESVYCHQVFEQQATVAYTQVHDTERQYHPFYQQFKIESYIGTPVWVDNTLYGTLCFFSTQVRDGFTHHEQEIIELMAQSMGKYLSVLKAEAELRAQKNFLYSVIDTPPNLIFAKDADGRFVLANRATAETYETTIPELMGKTVADCAVSVAKANLFSGGDRHVLETGESYVLEEELPAAGNSRYFQIVKKPISAGDEQTTLVLSVATEITERKRAEEQLLQAKEAAESANLAKSQFLASMSHELRTPLNAILGFTQIMGQDKTLSCEHQNSLSIVNRSGQHLLGLINDILEVSKIEAGNIQIEKDTFDLYQLLDNVEEMLQVKVANKPLQLIFNYGADIPQYISTDECKLRQILLNLLDNAIKFTPQGTVQLQVMKCSGPETQRDRQESLTRLSFAVQDTGPGLTAAEMQQVFQPFEQAQAGKQSLQGTGLGLAISQKFAQALGGDISVKSIVSQGAVFDLQIPVSQAQDILSRSAVFADAQMQIEHWGDYRVLVVDDDAISRLLMKKFSRLLTFRLEKLLTDRWH